MEGGRKARSFRLAALLVVLVGGGFAVVSGTWRSGVLGLSISAGLILFGVGELVRGEDRAVAVAFALTAVGVLGVLGHIARTFLFG